MAPTLKKGPTRSIRLTTELDKRLNIWMKKNHLDITATINLAIAKLLESEVVLTPVYASDKEIKSLIDKEIKSHRSELDKLK